MKVYFATRIRGFFKHLFSHSHINAEFDYEHSKIYEINNKLARFKTIIARSTLFDILGVIQTINCRNKPADIYASSNRFMKTDKPYFIYVENPTGLFHYRLNRRRFVFGKLKIRREISNHRLKGLVFMNNACAETFSAVCCEIPQRLIVRQIYPLVPLNQTVNKDYIVSKCKEPELKLLYTVQGKFFAVKGGLEILDSFDSLRDSSLNISLTIITKISDLPTPLLQRLKSTPGIILKDFNLSYGEMEKEYMNSHILLSPTSMDSFPLTILEAMKSGLAIIASELYAIPEMIEHGKNGFLCAPQYWFFTPDNIPNPPVWNHRKSTVYSNKKSERIILFLKEKILELYNDRALLTSMSIYSFTKASQPPFAEEYIAQQWNEFLSKIAET